MSSKFCTHETSDDESYNASLRSGKSTHIFVCHRYESEQTRMNIMGHLYSATVYLTDDEAYLLAQMLTDAVKSRKESEA